MSSEEIRQKFLEFFKERGHAIVLSSSLIPDDPSVLLTTAGMQQFKKYYTGELDPMKDFGSKNTASIQKSFRTSDIDEVGDESHLTFFEMLGNFSFGGYFKEGAIKYANEFITSPEWMGLKIEYVSVFGGDPSTGSGQAIPADEESEKIWRSLGVKKIEKAGREDNFWGPTGAEGPCGPTAEIYVNNALRQAQGKSPVEVWNLVFNEYYKYPDGHLEKLKMPGIDTGMGLERLAMVSQNVPTIFETDLFALLMELLPENMPERTKRIVVDHARGIVFLIADGVRPSNKEAGYILRRLIRRIIVQEYLSGASGLVLKVLAKSVDLYKRHYPELDADLIASEFGEENNKFQKTLKIGLRELEKIDSINAATAFKLYESYGLPYEVIKEVVAKKATNLTREGFDAELKKHQEISRAGVEKKFGGHGLALDTGELKAGSDEEVKKVTRFHTVTHLLNQALHDVLGDEVDQRGSDITPERTRFDFVFPRKLTPDELKKVEEIVNQKINENLPVRMKKMLLEDGVKMGVRRFYKGKYPEVAKVYYIGETEDVSKAYSKEFCGGPHVLRTGEIGKFKIIKEESSSAGVRRIRGIVE